MSLVSVIIPLYNNQRCINDAVKSCINQEHLLEIIIVDDFSTDNSYEVAKEIQAEHSVLVKLFRNNHKGGNNARNFGFEQAKGKYIQWLDSDDILLPGKFRDQVECLKQTHCDIVYSSGYLNTYNVKGELVEKEIIKSRNYNDFLIELLKDNWLPQHSYLLTRKAATRLHSSKAWNPLTVAAQDREYFTTAAILGLKFVFAEGDYFVYNRWQFQTSVSRKLPMERKAMIIVQMLKRFKDDIQQTNIFANNLKGRYYKVINTQVVYYTVIFKLGYDIREYRLSDIEWNLIKGIRSKIRIVASTILN